jgi:hypothetical protein
MPQGFTGDSHCYSLCNKYVAVYSPKTVANNGKTIESVCFGRIFNLFDALLRKYNYFCILKVRERI